MKKERPRFVGVIVAAVGLILGFMGFYRGEADTVFAKAIRVCLECIGIG